MKELNAIKQEREEKAARKEARANQKRLPKRDPMTAEIYKELIKEAEGLTYLHVRLRLALCLLAVTGVRINELLNIKVSQLKPLTQESCIGIDRFPINFLGNQMLPVAVFELAILPSCGKIPKILNLSNNRLVIKN